MSWEVKQEAVCARNGDRIPMWYVKNGTKCFSTYSPTDAEWLLAILTKVGGAEGLSFGPSVHDTCGSVLPYSMEALTSGDWCIDFTEEKDPATSIQKFLEWCDVVGLKWIDGDEMDKASELKPPRSARYLFVGVNWAEDGFGLSWDYDRRSAVTTIPFSSILPPKETT
jgi:hypothetical protein